VKYKICETCASSEKLVNFSAKLGIRLEYLPDEIFASIPRPLNCDACGAVCKSKTMKVYQTA